MDVLTTFEILGSLSVTGMAYLGAHNFGFDAPYWQIKDPEKKISYRDAAFVRRTWPKLARHLKLALRDDVPTVMQSVLATGNNKPAPPIPPPQLLRTPS